MRRRAQVLRARPDCTVEALRGNVNTRLRKLREKQYDAIVMAEAGQKRINLDVSDMKVASLSVEYFLPAPAQGALGLQIRVNDTETYEAVAKLNDPGTERLATAERSFLEHFGLRNLSELNEIEPMLAIRQEAEKNRADKAAEGAANETEELVFEEAPVETEKNNAGNEPEAPAE